MLYTYIHVACAHSHWCTNDSVFWFAQLTSCVMLLCKFPPIVITNAWQKGCQKCSSASWEMKCQLWHIPLDKISVKLFLLGWGTANWYDDKNDVFQSLLTLPINLGQKSGNKELYAFEYFIYIHTSRLWNQSVWLWIKDSNALCCFIPLLFSDWHYNNNKHFQWKDIPRQWWLVCGWWLVCAWRSLCLCAIDLKKKGVDILAAI